MSSIRPYIIINGKNSNEINGLIISSLPPISKPPMRAMSEEIDGRDGDIITKLGFSAYDKTIQIGLAGTYDVNAVIEYFNQEGVIIFSNEADKYYRFTQLNGIDFEKLIRFKTASVTFHCQPFKYSNSESPLNFFEPQTVEVTNSGNIYSKPELAITGKGFVDMKINNQDVLSLDFGESQQTLIIDSEKMNCYGARSNINKLDVAINPQQDLNGYESVWLAPNDTAPYRTRINNNIGNLALEKLVGVSCVFNQLINKNSLISSGTQLGLTITNNGDGSLSFSGTASATDWIQISTSFISAIIGHKYIINLNGNDTLKISDGYEFSNIVNWNHGDDLGLYVRPQENTQYNIKLYIMVFDLTALFGSEVADYLYTLESGNAGAGVSLFKSLFADKYYPYTANTLMSAKPTGKKIVGFNQWDEQWEVGALNYTNGNNQPNINNIRSKNFIPITPSTIFYIKAPTGQPIIVCEYDGTKTYINFLLYSYGNVTFTTSNNAHYIKFCTIGSPDYGATYNHDICINISDESKNGTYEPYSETTIVYSGNELRGLLKVGNNGLYADGDIDDGSGSTAVRYNRLTLSSTTPDNVMVDSIYMSGTILTVVLNEAYDHKHGDNYSLYNAICNLFDQDYFADLSSRSRAFAIQGNWSAIIFYDPILTTLEDWNTYLSNNPVIVDYELATPTTASSTAWSNPIIAKEGGTEEFTDSRTIKMFVGHDTIYGNICAINGWNECSVYRNGVNQWDEVTEAGSIDATTGANATDSSKLRSKNYIAVKSGKSYYFHTNNYDVNIYGYDSNKAFVSAIGTATKDESITIPNGIDYLRFVIESGYGTTYNHDISINYPSTITSYIEFEGVSNTFELGNDIVYGGVLDVATGILKLSCGLNTLGAFNYTYSDGYFKTDDLSDVVKAPADHDSKIKSVCEAFVYRKWNELANYDNSYAFDGTTGELRIKCSEITDASSFKSLMRNIHILYEVINPVEIQLTAWEIMSLIGENNIFANTGEIENCVYTKDGSEHEASGDIITFTINAHDIISDILRNRLVTGNYDNVRFKIGKNTITFIGLPDESQNVGEVDELSVSNYSRWL